MKSLERLKLNVRKKLRRAIEKDAFHKDFLRVIPHPLQSTARYVFYESPTADERRIARSIEAFRREILAATKELHSFSSPHSGTFSRDDAGHALTGPYVLASSQAHAKTGVGMQGGLLLRRIVAGLGAKRVLELGTNTGFSGCYFLSCPQVEQLVTIEGSADLCEIAQRNMSRVSNKFSIMNRLFDEAIDHLIETQQKFDCAFIDGQHEREATWHYTQRVLPLMNPGGAIIYDDIYWSDDMNQFWKELILRPELSTTIDFGYKGVALLRTDDGPKVHFDICDYIGRPRIYRKGW